MRAIQGCACGIWAWLCVLSLNSTSTLTQVSKVRFAGTVATRATASPGLPRPGVPQDLLDRPLEWLAEGGRNPAGAPERKDVSWAFNESLRCAVNARGGAKTCVHTRRAHSNALIAPTNGDFRGLKRYPSLVPGDPEYGESQSWLAAYHVRFGLTAGGTDARRRAPGAYIDDLVGSKIVVTCQPFPWEGDWRLGESLASGALVIANTMVDPYPGLINGVNVVLYNTTSQMLRLVKWYLEHPSAADRIAVAGQKLARAYTPERTVSDMIRLAWPAATAASPVKAHYFDLPKQCQNEESMIVTDGLNASKLVAVVGVLDDADLFILDIHRLNYCHDVGSKSRADAAILAARRAGIKVMALDFSDKPGPASTQDVRYDLYFKRSRVNRGLQRFVKFDRETVHPIYYPVKSQFTEDLLSHAVGIRPRAEREIDVNVNLPVWQHEG